MHDWKYEARDKLRELRAKRNAAAQLPGEIARLREEAEGLRVAAYDAVRVSGGGDRETALLNNLAQRGELERRLALTREDVARVETALAVLGKEDRDLLERMYVERHERGRAESLAAEMGLADASYLYRRVGDALRRFCVAYYGGCES